MAEPLTNNQRIAKNTIMLYIRMLLSVVVSLYTSRVVLEVLGVEDYGLYGLVGGVVSMFSFLNSTMAGATSRFLTFEMGKGDQERIRATFSSALLIHIGIALIVSLLAETIGLWFMSNKLVIPEGRMVAAKFVYQCSVISSIIAITQVPYNSLIIAHERMNVYAYVEILNVTLKLLIVYFLRIGNFDKLKLYGFFVLFVSILIMLIYRIYCIRNFPESRFILIWNKDILKPMLSFSGWDLYGNICMTTRHQGTNILINHFFGVIANASVSIATTVSGVIEGFTGSMITAFRPRIIKSYSQNDWVQMQSMLNNAIKFSTLFLIMLVIPILLETHFFINIWLGDVPKYLVSFIRILLIINSFGTINLVVRTGIQATGNIKRLSFYTGTIYLLTIPTSFLFLKLGFEAYIVYIVNLCSNILILSLNLWILKKQVKNVSVLSILSVILRVYTIGILTALPLILLSININSGLLRVLLISLFDIIVLSLLTYVIVLNKAQREFVKNRLKKIYYKVGKLFYK